MKKTNVNLVPDCVNSSPDYYCTWQTQLYATCDGKPPAQRTAINQNSLFDKEKPFGWAYFYEKARKDLFLVIDDGWDVPSEDDQSYYGCLVLNREKFSEYTEGVNTNTEALTRLSDKLKSLGWKGFGYWVCAQEADKFSTDCDQDEYWIERLKTAQKSGISYWKVDWGKKACDIDFRKFLTTQARKYAPNLIIEHSVIKDILPYSDVFRTYDVPAIMSIPMTMEKIKTFASSTKIEKGFSGLINCEDEAYIAAAGGFTMGIMRHPYVGTFTNGKPDMSFPEIHRNLKTKIYEVLRAARWHRIAPAFCIDGDNICIDDIELFDTWHFNNKTEEIEQWWFNMPAIQNSIENDVVTKSAPARISRNCELPVISADNDGNVPFVIASKNPSGAFSVATLGRTIERKYEIPKCDVQVNIEDAKTIAAFGEYKNLLLETSYSKITSVLMQDLADDTAYDITEYIVLEKNKIIIPGTLIHQIGTIAQPDEDTSEPGVVISLIIE